MRHFFQSRSISFRLYTIIIPTTIIAISGAGYLGDRAAVRMADARVEASTLRIATQLAADLSSDSLLKNPEALGRWVGEVVETNDFITRVDVYELSSNTIIRLATTSTSSRYAITIDEMTAARESKLLVVPQFKERDRFLKVIAPISGAGGGAGCVSVVSTLRQSDIMGEVHSRIALFLIPGSVLLLVAMLHYLLTRVLTRRVNYLLAAMTQARQGNLQKRVLPGAEDELGTIARIQRNDGGVGAGRTGARPPIGGAKGI